MKVNDAFARMLGYTTDEMLKLELKDFNAPESCRLISSRQSRIANGESLTFEVRLCHRDGRMLPFEVSASLIASNGEALIECFHRDISERKRVEAELQKLDKLQSVGTLAGGIAHDFNNILQGLYGNISLAKDDLAKDLPAYAALEEAEKSMSRAIQLTKQLLTFAKGGAPVKESVQLGALVEETAQADLAGSKVSLVFRQADDLWPVQADKGQLQQAISNLVINARQAMPGGGNLYVTVENEDVPDTSVVDFQQGRYVKITVRDGGIGIAPDVLGKIFDPYFTTKQAGSGLGLTAVWSIITQHNGHVGVVSELGKGTSFTLHLPAATSPGPEEVEPPAKKPPETAPATTAKLLVMDDEELILTYAARMLTRRGYAVATAPGGREAAELYRQALSSGTPFDAVILDLTIRNGPGGKEVIKVLQALDPNVRALVSSGYADNPVMASPATYGFKGALAKPYTPNELCAAVKRLLN